MFRILVIDDEKDARISLSALLKNRMSECSVMTVQSGLEGVEKAIIWEAKASPPDVKMK